MARITYRENSFRKDSVWIARSPESDLFETIRVICKFREEMSFDISEKNLNSLGFPVGKLLEAIITHVSTDLTRN
jgi:hypothetical protein